MEELNRKSLTGPQLDDRAVSILRRAEIKAAFSVAFLTAVLFLPGLDTALDGLNFDFLFRTGLVARPAVVVMMIALDSESYEDLNEPKRTPLNRRHHGALLRRLAAAGEAGGCV